MEANNTTTRQADLYKKSASEALDELIREHIKAFMTMEQERQVSPSRN